MNWMTTSTLPVVMLGMRAAGSCLTTSTLPTSSNSPFERMRAIAMSIPVSCPLSSSKCQGGLVEPVPTISLPRARTVRSRLSGAAWAAACWAPSAMAPPAAATARPPNPPSLMKSRRSLVCVIERLQRRGADPQAGGDHRGDQLGAGRTEAQCRAALVSGIARALDQAALLKALDDTLDRRRVHRGEASELV